MLITSSWKSEKPINQMARAFLTPKGLPSDLDLQLEKKKNSETATISVEGEEKRRLN